MKNIITKADQWLYDKSTYWTVAWVKKHKFAKHKYHLLGKIQVYWLCFLVFLGAFFGVTAILHHKLLWAGILGMFWLLLFTMELFDLAFIVSLSHEYDWLFDRRKDPTIYNIMKAKCQMRFEEQARGRQFLIIFFAGVGFLVLFFHASPLLLPLYFLNTYRQYVHCIFDFDPPDKKKKPKESRLTDLARGVWERLTESFKPQQAPQPAG